MSQDIWSDVHSRYAKEDWIDKPSLFAETVVKYFSESGTVLELGAGQGQDSRFFAGRGYHVVSTDNSDFALEENRKKISPALRANIDVQKLDISSSLSFPDRSFEAVYAHLSIHYFDSDTTARLFQEVKRVLKPGGVFAFLVNSSNDPEYGAYEQIEPDFFRVDGVLKRYFSVETVRKQVFGFEVCLLDDFGETYKDAAIGVHGLIRFVGKKPLLGSEYRMAIPFVGGIIERHTERGVEVLMQTRWKPGYDPLYSGTLEFPAGVLDLPYEHVYEALRREIREECGLELKSIRGDSRTKNYEPKGVDESFGFRPYCCVQQLKEGRPWIGFIFVCEVEDGEPKAQVSETRDPCWMSVAEVRRIFTDEPEKLFTLEIPAWEFYLREHPENE